MERTLRVVSWRELLAFMLRAIGVRAAETRQLGEVMLREHQAAAVERILDVMRRRRGALLADDVGLGKTYVALAVASRLNTSPVVVAPASLRDMWVREAARADIRMRFVSVESLSRKGSVLPRCRLLIIDEAHALRNPRTNRYDCISAAIVDHGILLLSATPVHNTERDLRALLALIIGSGADELAQHDVADLVIRREALHARSPEQLVPEVVHAELPPLPRQDDLLERILSLPPPVPPSDAGEGGALLAFTLVRQWSSSQHTFVRALSRRLRHGVAMLEALQNGVHPSSADLRSWCAADAVLQLPLFGLVQSPHHEVILDRAALTSAIGKHLNALRELLTVAKAAEHVDRARVEMLRHICAAHDGEKVLAFSQFADTVRSFFRASLHWGRTGMLTASSATIASGAVAREELLRLFAPRASGALNPPESRRVDLLFSTDVISEGCNLQDATVLIHLDLPWTPVRLAQRVGRIARQGSRARRVTVYTFPPPAGADALLRMERRIAAKLSVASRRVGTYGTVLPLLHVASHEEMSPPQLDAHLRTLLAELASPDVPAVSPDDLLVSRVGVSHSEGFVALLERNGQCRLIAGDASGTGRELEKIVSLIDSLRSARTTSESAVAIDHAILRVALQRIQSWISADEARSSAGLQSTAYVHARRHLMRRIDAISVRAPLHLRARIHELAARARSAAVVPCGSGAEKVLAQLASAPLGDEAWLRALGTFGELHAPGANNNAFTRIRAVLLLSTRQ